MAATPLASEFELFPSLCSQTLLAPTHRTWCHAQVSEWGLTLILLMQMLLLQYF